MGSYHVYQQYDVQNELLYPADTVKGKLPTRAVISAAVLKGNDLARSILLNDLVSNSINVIGLNKLTNFIDSTDIVEFPSMSPGALILDDTKRSLLKDVIEEIEQRPVTVVSTHTSEPTQHEWDKWNTQEGFASSVKPHKLYHIVQYKIPDNFWNTYPTKVYLYEVYSNKYSVFPPLSLTADNTTVSYTGSPSTTPRNLTNTNLVGELEEGLEITIDFGTAVVLSDFKFTFTDVNLYGGVPVNTCLYTILYSNTFEAGRPGYITMNQGTMDTEVPAYTGNAVAATADVISARYWAIRIDIILGTPDLDARITNIEVNKSVASQLDRDTVTDANRGAHCKVIPPVFLRRNNTNFFEATEDGTFTEEASYREEIDRYLDIVQIDGEDLVNSVMDNPDIVGNEHFIDNISIHYGVPLLSNDTISARYLYNYFLHLYAAGVTSQNVKSTNYDYDFNCSSIDYVFTPIADFINDPTSDKYTTYHSDPSKFRVDGSLRVDYFTNSQMDYLSQYIASTQQDIADFLLGNDSHLINPLFVGSAIDPINEASLGLSDRLFTLNSDGASSLYIHVEGTIGDANGDDTGSLFILKGDWVTELSNMESLWELYDNPNIIYRSQYDYTINNNFVAAADVITIYYLAPDSTPVDVTVKISSDLGYGLIKLANKIGDLSPNTLYIKDTNDAGETELTISNTVSAEIVAKDEVSYFHVTTEGISEYIVRTPTASYKVVDAGSGQYNTVTFKATGNNLAELLLPLNSELVISYANAKEAGDLLIISTHVSIYIADYYKVKKKWYERGIFKLIITFLSFYFFGPAGGWASMTTAQVVAYVISQLIINMMIGIIISSIIRILAPESELAAVIVAVFTYLYLTGFDFDFSNLKLEDVTKMLVQVTDVIAHVGAVVVQEGMLALEAEKEELMSEYEDAMNSMKDLLESMMLNKNGDALALLDVSVRSGGVNAMDPEAYWRYQDSFCTRHVETSYMFSERFDRTFSQRYVG